jgi:hypothetical protein
VVESFQDVIVIGFFALTAAGMLNSAVAKSGVVMAKMIDYEALKGTLLRAKKVYEDAILLMKENQDCTVAVILDENISNTQAFLLQIEFVLAYINNNVINTDKE